MEFAIIAKNWRLKMTKKVEKLGYDYDALEPYIDEETMRVHHDKHYQTYFDKFNEAIKDSELEDMGVEEILSDISHIPKDIRQTVINHGGGYFNHRFFWTILGMDIPFEGEIAEAITEKWGSYEDFKEEFSEAAKKLFGSGWVWLVLNKDELEIVSTPNQGSPISEGMKPLLSLDIWEHAYYLKYQNRRAEYIEAFFKVINWERVNEYYLDNQND